VEAAVIVDLPSTTTADIAKRLVRLRADTGSMALSRVLTLLVVVDEGDADAAIETANDASRQHPCRIIVVVTGNRRGAARLDGQIRVGGDAGASEVVVLRHGADGVRRGLPRPLHRPPRDDGGVGEEQGGHDGAPVRRQPAVEAQHDDL
jgi:hypothetical protein